MAYQTIFKRYEIKYILSLEEKEKLLNAMKPYMALDKYGRTTIRNIYFDTDNYRLIRRSIEKPIYKEKLRVRSYSKANENDTVFVELKKKYRHIVYKRRLSMPKSSAVNWLCCSGDKPNTQIAEEIEYFRKYYENLKPVVFLSYEREAYYSCAGDDLRITFDENILARQTDLSLNSDVWGERLIDSSHLIAEIKTSGGMPLWLIKLLSQEHIYKTSFSKYGTAYQNIIYPQIKGEILYA